MFTITPDYEVIEFQSHNLQAAMVENAQTVKSFLPSFLFLSVLIYILAILLWKATLGGPNFGWLLSRAVIKQTPPVLQNRNTCYL